MTRLKQLLVPVAFAASLAACAQTDGISPFDDLLGPRADFTDLAYAALARGDYPTAARRAEQALQRDADDPHALFAQALALEYTDNVAPARATYERLVSMPAAEQAMIGGGWAGVRPGRQQCCRGGRQRLKTLGMMPATPLIPAEPLAATAGRAIGRCRRARDGSA